MPILEGVHAFSSMITLSFMCNYPCLVCCQGNHKDLIGCTDCVPSLCKYVSIGLTQCEKKEQVTQSFFVYFSN